MKTKTQSALKAALLSTGCLQSTAALQLETTIEIPRLSVAEYHRPYVAVWIEDSGRKAVENLSVLYDVKMSNEEGETWLKDLRQWWRKSGRSQDMPIDGVSGPTRPPGIHRIVYRQGESGFFNLPAGNYAFVVEASREVGGREMIRIPFEWDGQNLPELSAQGSRELGTVTFKLQTNPES
ncbi:DUF2271 domain-containing protein [Coraliomargarita sp. SDUM461003]|uniref:DUF2271 domain-containing protein n=1 Tax=Thalassobacterium maritimum TaxID=3041265 RepID=A0ABU1AWY4_9BACT|nr:DUF2271 domain-containing protein [Coraliomargarita sp. SDUM461003]MDQ8208596.1 DUF2271 domain-containing protein [Coraliomargarita sp. SDUM461003]